MERGINDSAVGISCITSMVGDREQILVGSERINEMFGPNRANYR